MLFEDRASYDAMLAESWSDTTRSRAAGVRLVELLRDAEQAHQEWAAAELEALLVDGATRKCRTWRQDQTPRVITPEGTEVKTTGGARVRDVETGDPGETYEQLAFADMERPQLLSHLAILASQVKTTQATIAAIGRLLGVLDKVPEAKTPRDACKQLGTTVEAVMAGERAA